MNRRTILTLLSAIPFLDRAFASPLEIATVADGFIHPASEARKLWANVLRETAPVRRGRACLCSRGKISMAGAAVEAFMLSEPGRIFASPCQSRPLGPLAIAFDGWVEVLPPIVRDWLGLTSQLVAYDQERLAYASGLVGEDMTYHTNIFTRAEFTTITFDDLADMIDADCILTTDKPPDATPGWFLQHDKFRIGYPYRCDAECVKHLDVMDKLAARIRPFVLKTSSGYYLDPRSDEHQFVVAEREPLPAMRSRPVAEYSDLPQRPSF